MNFFWEGVLDDSDSVILQKYINMYDFYTIKNIIFIQNILHLIGEGFEPKPGTVVRGGLLGISNPPLDMVKIQKFSFFWFGTLQK